MALCGSVENARQVGGMWIHHQWECQASETFVCWSPELKDDLNISYRQISTWFTNSLNVHRRRESCRNLEERHTHTCNTMQITHIVALLQSGHKTKIVLIHSWGITEAKCLNDRTKSKRYSGPFHETLWKTVLNKVSSENKLLGCGLTEKQPKQKFMRKQGHSPQYKIQNLVDAVGDCQTCWWMTVRIVIN